MQHLVGLHQLKCGGYPFGPDDLPLETWADLGQLHNYLQDYRLTQLIRVIAGTAGARI